jgi:hypothetical protein
VIHVYDRKTPEQVTGVFLFLSCISYAYVVTILEFVENKKDVS